jgi:hypothetical protein
VQIVSCGEDQVSLPLTIQLQSVLSYISSRGSSFGTFRMELIPVSLKDEIKHTIPAASDAHASLFWIILSALPILHISTVLIL